jgi:MFS family permease
MALRHNRNFLRLWAGQTISVFGSLITGTALPFTAILALGATPVQMGLLAAAGLLPKFLVGLVAGAWVDRLPRRPLMIAADLGRAALLVTIPLAASFHHLHIEHLYVVAFLQGVLNTVFDIAYTAYLPELISRQELVEGNSRLTATASAAEFCAFGLGGWLVQWFGGPVAVLIDAATFLGSAAFLAAIRAPEPAPGERPARDAVETPDLRREIGEGLRAVLDHPLLRSLAAATVLLDFSFRLGGTVILLFTNRTLGFPPGILGMIFAVGGVTSLLGALAAGPLTRRIGAGPTMIGGLCFTGLGVLFVPLARGATPLSAAFLVANQVVTDPAYTVYEINQVSLRQAVTPDRLLGRVNATLRFLGFGAMLLGTLLGGLLGQHAGLRATLLLGGTGTLLAAALLAISPVRDARQDLV